jgi:hypothetical protein
MANRSITRAMKQSGEQVFTPYWAMADPPVSARIVVEERIRQRAYELSRERERLGVPGDAVADWLRAEQELRQKEGVYPR